MKRSTLFSAFFLVIFCLLPLTALAHSSPSHAGSFAGGVLHPFTGVDHLLGILAASLWVGLVPNVSKVRFLLFMLGSALLGLITASVGWLVPGVEMMVFASVFVFGVSLLCLWQPRTRLTLGLLTFGFFVHGHAHGAEIQTGLVAQSAGFLLGVGVIYVAGVIAAQFLARSDAERISLRLTGALTILAGCLIL